MKREVKRRVCLWGVQTMSARLWNQRFCQIESIEVELTQGLKSGLCVDSSC